MESLELCENVFAEHDSTRLSHYYDSFKYRGVLRVQYIEYFRNAKNLNDFHRCLDKKNYNEYYSYTKAPSSVVRQVIEKHCPENYNIIEKFILWRENKTVGSKEVRIVINFSHISLYFNDFEKVKDLNDVISSLGKNFKYSYSNVLPDFKKDVIYHKDPKHKFRVFLKPVRLYNQDKEDFVKFLLNYDFGLSRALTDSIAFKFRTLSSRNILSIQNTHYLDYDNESLLTLLAITYPDIIRKVCTIEKY